MVIDHGAVPIFVKLLGSPSDDVREQVHSCCSFISLLSCFRSSLFLVHLTLWMLQLFSFEQWIKLFTENLNFHLQ